MIYYHSYSKNYRTIMEYGFLKNKWLAFTLLSVLLFTGIWYINFGTLEKACRSRVMGAKVEIYTKASCIFCRKAKDLLASKNISFEEYDITNCPNTREEMLRRSANRQTVPQIFIHGIHIGGFDDINLLNKVGKLEELLEITH